MLHNPYIAGSPLTNRNTFFGREDIVREVMQMLHHPDEKAIVLFGQRRIGKTSILLQLAQRLEEEGSFTPVFFDLMDKASATLPEVIYKLTQVIATRVNLPIGSLDQFDMDCVYFKETFLPKATQVACQEGLVILFDEFDVMDSPNEGQAGQAFFPYLRGCLNELQKVKFIFVIGRRPEELSTNTLATFKGIRAARVSSLSRPATEQIIRQSEKSFSLNWTQEALDRIWSLTEGHAYFTQLLCSVVWENAREEAEDNTIPIAQLADVDRAIPEAQRHGANAFAWIWDGLPPAERVIMAAMAEGPERAVQPDEIETILNRSGVRLIVSQLKLAPSTLVDWEVLRPAEGGYRFAVPLMRLWIKANRPLSRVKEELDRLDPLAETLFRAGQSFYTMNRKDEAIQQLRQALTVNPNHLKSHLLLGRIYLEQGTLESINMAAATLEEAYQYDSSAALPDLTKALLSQSELETDVVKRLGIYDRILERNPGQPIATEKRAAIWRYYAEQALAKGEFDTALRSFIQANDDAGQRRVKQAEQQYWANIGEEAYNRGEFTRAMEAFQKAGDQARVNMILDAQRKTWIEEGEKALAANDLEKAEKMFEAASEEERLQAVRDIIKARWLNENLKEGGRLVSNENWEAAAQTYRTVLERYPNHPEAEAGLRSALDEVELLERYNKAIALAEAHQPQEAKKLLVQIISIRPEYKQAAHYLSDIIDGKYSIPKSQQISNTTTAEKGGKSVTSMQETHMNLSTFWGITAFILFLIVLFLLYSVVVVADSGLKSFLIISTLGLLGLTLYMANRLSFEINPKQSKPPNETQEPGEMPQSPVQVTSPTSQESPTVKNNQNKPSDKEQTK